MENAQPDSSMRLELVNTTLPYGKYQERLLIDLPEPYVVWMYGNGFPKGKLGQQLQLLYEIKLNGLESLVTPLKKPPLPQIHAVGWAAMPNTTFSPHQPKRQIYTQWDTPPPIKK